MDVKPFVPNWEKNLGKDFSIHGQNGAKEKPEASKKKTTIKGAIKTADEVKPAIEKIIKHKDRPTGSKNKR